MSTFPITGLRGVDLMVPDLLAAIWFYTDVWGIEPSYRIAGIAWLRGTGSNAQLIFGTGIDV